MCVYCSLERINKQRFDRFMATTIKVARDGGPCSLHLTSLNGLKMLVMTLLTIVLT